MYTSWYGFSAGFTGSVAAYGSSLWRNFFLYKFGSWNGSVGSDVAYMVPAVVILVLVPYGFA